MSIVNDQIALQAHLDSAKAETLAWVAVDPNNRWGCYAVTDLAHWAEQGIYTVAQYEHHVAAAEHYDFYKEVNGIRPRWMDYDSMTTAEIEAEIQQLADWADSAREEDIEREEHWDMINAEAERFSAIFDDVGPTKYEEMAEAAGF